MAGKTFTEQLNMPVTAETADGQGMHSLIPHDFVRGLNNLGTYVNNHMHYVQGSGASMTVNAFTAINGRMQNFYTGASREMILFQVPVFAPLWAVRMAWTSGARCVAVSMSTLTVYLARDPYFGDATSTFDVTLLSSGYLSRVASSLGLTTGAYGFSADTTGITPIDNGCTRVFSPGQGRDTKRKGYLIVTGTGGTDATVAVEDFTVWFLPS